MTRMVVVLRLGMLDLDQARDQWTEAVRSLSVDSAILNHLKAHPWGTEAYVPASELLTLADRSAVEASAQRLAESGRIDLAETDLTFSRDHSRLLSIGGKLYCTVALRSL